MHGTVEVPQPSVRRTYCTNDLERIFSVTRETLRKWMRAGKLPQPLQSPGRKLVWCADTIDRLLTEGRSHGA